MKKQTTLCSLAVLPLMCLAFSGELIADEPGYHKPADRGAPNVTVQLNNPGTASRDSMSSGYIKPAQRELSAEQAGRGVQLDKENMTKAARNVYQKPGSDPFHKGLSARNSAPVSGFHKPGERKLAAMQQANRAASNSSEYKKPAQRRLEQQQQAQRQVLEPVVGKPTRFVLRKGSPQFDQKP